MFHVARRIHLAASQSIYLTTGGALSERILRTFWWRARFRCSRRGNCLRRWCRRLVAHRRRLLLLIRSFCVGNFFFVFFLRRWLRGGFFALRLRFHWGRRDGAKCDHGLLCHLSRFDFNFPLFASETRLHDLQCVFARSEIRNRCRTHSRNRSIDDDSCSGRIRVDPQSPFADRWRR